RRLSRQSLVTGAGGSGAVAIAPWKTPLFTELSRATISSTSPAAVLRRSVTVSMASGFRLEAGESTWTMRRCPACNSPLGRTEIDAGWGAACPDEALMYAAQ